jgi:hypothetical protein
MLGKDKQERKSAGGKSRRGGVIKGLVLEGGSRGKTGSDLLLAIDLDFVDLRVCLSPTNAWEGPARKEGLRWESRRGGLLKVWCLKEGPEGKRIQKAVEIGVLNLDFVDLIVGLSPTNAWGKPSKSGRAKVEK